MNASVEAIARAAYSQPWWLDVGGEGYMCAVCSVGVPRVPGVNPRCAAAHEQGNAEEDIERCPMIPLDAALDALEAAAEGVV